VNRTIGKTKSFYKKKGEFTSPFFLCLNFITLLQICNLMKQEVIEKLLGSFESAVHKLDGVEFWYARELQNLLGYSKWEVFEKVILKAKHACAGANQEISDHFLPCFRLLDEQDQQDQQTSDLKLTRYACYLIAQNGNPVKDEVAFSMSYFAMQTRKQEMIEQHLHAQERLQAREKLTMSEKRLSGVLFGLGIDSIGFAKVRSKGDQALFGGKSTTEMKQSLGIPESRSLADFLPTITIKAKDFANEITNFNIKKDALESEQHIIEEHIKNNTDVRKLLAERGIKPEELPAEEDVKKVERKLKAQDKQILKQAKKLSQIQTKRKYD